MNPFSSLLAPVGSGIGNVKSYSHFNDPIPPISGQSNGNSRIYGDATAATQEASINTIIQAAVAAGLDQSDKSRVRI